MRVIFKPLNLSAEVEAGVSLLKAAQKAGIRLDSDCGGMGRCGKCKVIVSRGVTSVTPREREYLTPAEVNEQVRLACQTLVKAATSVLLTSILPGKDRILEEGISRPVRVRPLVRKQFLGMSAEIFKQERSIAEIIADHMVRSGLKKPFIPFRSLKMIPAQASKNQEGITAVMKGSEVLAFEPGDSTSHLYGLAVDIGTTTVVGYLLNLKDGNIVGVNSALNGQAVHGSDVISRIDHALNAPDGVQQLQQAVLNTINGIIGSLGATTGVSAEQIYSVVIVGNTAMNHLFWGISPRFLSRSPYNTLTRDSLCFPAMGSGLTMNPAGVVVSLPLVSGFIGSDTIGVVLATRLHKSRVPKMAIDIGTNGEIVLTDGKSIVACSCAAGPAFEGAQIQCGMRGTSGAIDRVTLDGGSIRHHVIDEVPPRGICGSGLVDIVAGMLKEGIIDCTGKFLSPEESGNPAYARWITQGSFKQFILNSEESTSTEPEIVITQKDIREFQLAKGAMTAGIRILMAKLGLQEKDIREVYLAGAFGNYVRAKSAFAVGLLPAFENAAITQVGNAAGSGAKMALLSTASLKEAIRIAERIEYVELARISDFQQEFLKGMVFPA